MQAEMIEQAYSGGLKHTQVYTLDDTSYHSCIVSDISEKPVIHYQNVYNSQNIRRSQELHEKAKIKVEEKDFDSARRILDTALALNPKLLPALTQRGCLQYNNGYPLQALVDFHAVTSFLAVYSSNYFTHYLTQLFQALMIDPVNEEVKKYLKLAEDAFFLNDDHIYGDKTKAKEDKESDKKRSRSKSRDSSSDSDQGRRHKKKSKKHKHKNKKAKKKKD